MEQNWVFNNFICKELYAPFHVEKDVEYFGDLHKKYNILKKQAKNSGADSISIKIIDKYTDKIYRALNSYYNGKISSSHQIIKNFIKDCMDDRLAVSSINQSEAFPGDKGDELQLFRARVSNDLLGFKAKEMLHLPLTERGKTGNYRFSIPGIPSLYLGNSSYACWIETGRPSDHEFNVSPVLLDGEQKILNLAVIMRDLRCLNEGEEGRVFTWLKLLILMIATSYIVDEKDRTFKSEYIVSQSIMLACKELGLDGVAYYSKRVSDELFAIAAVNLALFTSYKKNEEYSDLCKHLKIDNSFNFSLYEKLNLSLKYKEYDLRIGRTEYTTNIGQYERQYPYIETQFYGFDKFIYSSWKDKDKLLWGNAVN
jgi:hypothetical protein